MSPPSPLRETLDWITHRSVERLSGIIALLKFLLSGNECIVVPKNLAENLLVALEWQKDLTQSFQGSGADQIAKVRCSYLVFPSEKIVVMQQLRRLEPQSLCPR